MNKAEYDDVTSLCESGYDVAEHVKVERQKKLALDQGHHSSVTGLVTPVASVVQRQPMTPPALLAGIAADSMLGPMRPSREDMQPISDEMLWPMRPSREDMQPISDEMTLADRLRSRAQDIEAVLNVHAIAPVLDGAVEASELEVARHVADLMAPYEAEDTRSQEQNANDEKDDEDAGAPLSELRLPGARVQSL